MVYDIDGNVISESSHESIKLPNVVLMGDSITDNIDDHGWWVDMLTRYVTFESLTNYAVGYARWTFYSNTSYDIVSHSHTPAAWNVIWNQFNRLKHDVDNEDVPVPDAIVILAGTNDINLDCNIGDVDVAFDGNDILSKSFANIMTVAQSIRYTCECIINEYPNTQVILATPNQQGGYSKEARARQVRDVIIGCAKRLSMSVINQMDESGIYSYNETIGNYDLGPDNVHPNNTTGSLQIAQYMSRQMLDKINIRA